MITPTQLRTDFPEFQDAGTFLDSTLNFWLNVAYTMLNADRFGDTLDFAAELFAAHNVVLSVQNQKAAAASGVPGVARGVISSESAGGVSVGYDTGAATVPGRSHWNLTIYGIQLSQLVEAFGAGPVYISAGGEGGYGTLYSAAWPGPGLVPAWW